MLHFRGIGRTLYLVMAELVPAIPAGEAASFPIGMAGTGPAMTRSSELPNSFRFKRSML